MISDLESLRFSKAYSSIFQPLGSFIISFAGGGVIVGPNRLLSQIITGPNLGCGVCVRVGIGDGGKTIVDCKASVEAGVAVTIGTFVTGPQLVINNTQQITIKIFAFIIFSQDLISIILPLLLFLPHLAQQQIQCTDQNLIGTF
jgi:hypothetical protein